MPISEILYGDDHPRFKQPGKDHPSEYRYMQIHEHLPERVLKKVARKFPRCRKYLRRG